MGSSERLANSHPPKENYSPQKWGLFFICDPCQNWAVINSQLGDHDMVTKNKAECTEKEWQDRLEYKRNWAANMTEEQKENRAEARRKRRANMTEEERKRTLEINRKCVANRTEEDKALFALKSQIGKCRSRAKQRGVPFNLTLDHILEIWPPDNKCPVFGTPFVRGKGEQCPTSPNLDRIEPDKGYTIDNVQVISARANRIKTDATAAEVMMVAQYLLKKERERE